MFKREEGMSRVALTITILILLILVVFVLIAISRRDNQVFYEENNVNENIVTNEETSNDDRITEYPINDETLQNFIS